MKTRDCSADRNVFIPHFCTDSLSDWPESCSGIFWPAPGIRGCPGENTDAWKPSRAFYFSGSPKHYPPYQLSLARSQWRVAYLATSQLTVYYGRFRVNWHFLSEKVNISITITICQAGFKRLYMVELKQARVRKVRDSWEMWLNILILILIF
jgi:hypothetical protein